MARVGWLVAALGVALAMPSQAEAVRLSGNTYSDYRTISCPDSVSCTLSFTLPTNSAWNVRFVSCYLDRNYGEPYRISFGRVSKKGTYIPQRFLSRFPDEVFEIKGEPVTTIPVGFQPAVNVVEEEYASNITISCAIEAVGRP